LTQKHWRNVKKITLLSFALALLTLLLLISPLGQSMINAWLTSKLVENRDIDVTIGSLFANPVGDTSFSDVLIRDHKGDTLIYIGQFEFESYRIGQLINNNIHLGNAKIDGLFLNVKRHNKDKKTNLDLFAEKLKPKTPNGRRYEASKINVVGAKLSFADNNKAKSIGNTFTDLHGELSDFSLQGDVVSFDINQMSFFVDEQDLQVTNLQTQFSHDALKTSFENLVVSTPNSLFASDVKMTYPKGGMQSFNEKVRIDAVVRETVLGLGDIQKIYPDVSTDGSVVIQYAKFMGTLNDFSVSSFKARFEKSMLSGALSHKANQSFFTITTLSTTYDDIARLIPSFNDPKYNFIQRSGTLNVKGNISLSPSTSAIDVVLGSSLGFIDIDVDFTNSKQGGETNYRGKIKSKRVDVGRLLNHDGFGSTAFALQLSGKGFDRLNTRLWGDLTAFSYGAHPYQNISVDIRAVDKLIRGVVDIADSNANIRMEGSFDSSGELWNISSNTQIDDLNLHVINPLLSTKEMVFSGNIELVSQGTKLNDFIGDISVSDSRVVSNGEVFDFDELTIQSRLNKDIRFINLRSSDVLNGLIYGRFRFSDLRKMTENAVGGYFSNFKKNKVDGSAFVNFNVNVKEKISRVLSSNIIVDDNTFLRGKLSGNHKDFALQVEVPNIYYSSNSLSDISLTIDNSNPLYNGYIQVQKFENENVQVHNFKMINTSMNDTLYFRAEYDGGSVKNNLNFYVALPASKETIVGIQPSKIVFQNKQWEVNQERMNASKLRFNRDGYKLEPIVFTNDNSVMHLSIDQQQKQRIQATFENVFLADILTSKPKLTIEGVANGNIDITRDQSVIGGEANVQIDSLLFNDSFLGDASFNLSSINDDEYRLQFSTAIEELSTSEINGLIYTSEGNTNLDLHANFAEFPASILDRLIGNALTDVSGKLHGSVSVSGRLDQPLLNGEMFFDAVQLSVPYLNVGYAFVDQTKLEISPTSFRFLPTTVLDTSKNTSGLFAGSILHRNFDFFTLDMNFDSDGLLILDTDYTPNINYYGSAFLSGNAHIHGPSGSLTFDVSGKSAKGTNIYIPIDNETSIENVSYIRFVDKNIKNQDSELSDEETQIKGLSLNFDLNITSDAQLEIVFDSETGSTLSGRGVGNILMEIDTNGRFGVWGDFIALDGAYNFRNLGIIEKEFSVQPGGTIVWNGDPFDAQMNLQAVYEVPGGANPAILLETPGLNRKILTDVTINLTGSLLKPETPTFSIDFPNTSSNVRNELQYRLDDEERRQIQAISLLSQGVFISDLSLSAISAQTLTNNLFQKASGVFESIFSGDEDKVKLGLDYLQGDRNAAETTRTRDRLGLTLVTEVSERLLINGKVGVPVGGVEETIIVGDVTIEFLLSKDGALRARIFNRENEFQYFGDELGYTQGVGLSYRVGFEDFKSLIKKIVKKNPI
jgi:hypothetical protein